MVGKAIKDARTKKAHLAVSLFWFCVWVRDRQSNNFISIELAEDRGAGRAQAVVGRFREPGGGGRSSLSDQARFEPSGSAEA